MQKRIALENSAPHPLWWGYFVLLVVLLAPLHLALWRYAYRSSNVWSPEDRHD